METTRETHSAGIPTSHGSELLGKSLLTVLWRWLGVSLAAFVPYLLLGDVVEIGEGALPWALGTALALGLLAAIAWTAREARVDSARVEYYLQAVIRYGLGYVFIGYAMAKLFGAQFKVPSAYQLDRPLGDLAGIEIAWAFFGYSFAYATFIALSQIVCSLLLFFRRTQLLGACLLLPIIGNIVFINFTHHIPVKLYSSIYLVMTLYLVLVDFRSLKAVFWDHTVLPARTFPALDPRFRTLRAIAKAAFIIASFAYTAWMFDTIMTPVREVATPLYGIWRVEEIEPPAAMAAGQLPWRKVLFENQYGGKEGSIKFDKLGEEEHVRMEFALAPARHGLVISPQGPKGKEVAGFAGTYDLQGTRLVLQGRLGGVPARITLKRIRPR